MQRKFSSQVSKKSAFAFLLKNWWVGVLITMGIAIHVQALDRKNQCIRALENKVVFLKEEKSRALEKKEQLKIRTQMFDDPEWMLLVLKQRLGLVEEGEIKVIFTKKKLCPLP